MLFAMHITRDDRTKHTQRKEVKKRLPFKNQSIFFLSEAQCHLFPSNCAAEANSFSRRAAKLGQYRK